MIHSQNQSIKTAMLNRTAPEEISGKLLFKSANPLQLLNFLSRRNEATKNKPNDRGTIFAVPRVHNLNIIFFV